MSFIIPTILTLFVFLTLMNVMLGYSFASGSLDVLGYSQVFSIETGGILGALAIIIAISVIVTLIGIQVLGSGLDTSSVSTLTIIILYYGLYITFSVATWNLIASIQIVGVLLYIGITILYSYGVIQKISSNINV
jgi:hypothetical protein